jgi:hypothetical protein
MALACVLLPAARAGGGHAPPTAFPRAAIHDVLALFEKTPIVAFGEIHGLEQPHTFLRALLADPQFGRTVHTVVVEFGNAKYQATADAYVLGQRAVSRDELRQVWRNTTQSWVNTWDAPIYERFFQTVRAVNQARPRGQRPLRVVLGDPPIDWAKVRTPADTLPFADRDGFAARQVEQTVLARGERALLVMGLGHTARLGPAALRSSGTAAERIEAAHPGTVSSLMVYVGFPDELRRAGQQLLSLGFPRLLRTQGT